MSRVCQITGAGTRFGGTIARRGLPKSKGGVGLKTTGREQRTYKVNVQKKRIWVPELQDFVSIRVSTRGLRTITKNGAYPTLLKAGVIKPVKPNPEKAAKKAAKKSASPAKGAKGAKKK